MKTAAGLLALAMGLGLGIATGASADVLETRDGRILEGRFLGGTQQSVRFEVGGNVEVFAVGDVLALTFTKPPASQAAAPSATPPRAAAAPKKKRRASAPKPSGAAPAQASTPATKTATAPSPAPAPAPAASRPAAAEPARSAPAAAVPAPPTAPRILRAEAGTRLLVRMADTVDPRHVTEGDRFAATLDAEVAVEGRVIAPARAKVYGTVTEAKTTGPVTARLKLELTELMLQGQMFTIVTGTQKVVAALDASGEEAPAKAATGPASGRVASGALLEFRLLQPFELRPR